MKTRKGDFSVSYAHVAETACLTGAKQFHKFAKPARYITFKSINTYNQIIKSSDHQIITKLAMNQ